MTIVYAFRLVLRNPRRTLTYLFGLALAVGLFAGILFFVDATARQMTTHSIAPVKIDYVARPTKPELSIIDAARAIGQQRGVLSADPVFAADFAAAQKVGSAQTTPTGRLFALPLGYFDHIDVLHMSEGAFTANGAVISEAMAKVQQIKVGDTISVTFAGVPQSAQLPVTGIVNMDGAEALFSTPTGAEGAVFADVILVDTVWFAKRLSAPLAALAANRPADIPPAITLLDPQIHIKINRDLLPADPTVAVLQAASLQRAIERPYPGLIKALDNLSKAFKTARADVLSAKILFIFLGLPGVALAAYLSKFAAELFADAQRRELSLLRTRGATQRQITAIIAVSSILLAVMGSALGVVVGLVALLVSAGQQALTALNPFASGFNWQTFAASAGVAFGAGLALTFLSAFVPTFSAMRREITEERRRVLRTSRPPFWKRAYLDLILIGAAVVVLVVTQLNGGFSIAGVEGAAVSLSFYVFLAPFFIWIGLTLLMLRLIERGLGALGQPLAALYRKPFGEIGDVAGKSIARRAASVGAATTIIALTLSFGLSLALFQNTYTAEKRRDAQYVAGSDVRFTPSLNASQTLSFVDQLIQPGVQAVTGVLRDPQALVGSSTQSVYGIDVASFRRVAYLPDSFFVDVSAQKTLDAINSQVRNYSPANFAPGRTDATLDALQSTPNGVLVAVDIAQKFNILPGDPVNLRLFNPKTRQYADVTAQAVGMYIQFSTSSQDSDFILNRDFMAKALNTDTVTFFLLKTDGQTGTTARVADALHAKFKDVMPFRIDSTDSVINLDASSLTALNLGGLGAMERMYTVLVVSAGLAVFLLAMINERRREFGAMRALGANLRHLRRFLLAEAATIGGLSLIIGGVIGVGLARLLVLLLGVIFTVPTMTLEVPWLDVSVLVALVIAGMAFSTWLSSRQLASLKVVEALREL